MFYKLDAARVTLREFWWETKIFAWVGLLVKLLRIRLRGSSDDLAVDSLRPFQVDESAIPGDMLAHFAPVLNELQSLGFGAPVWHYEEDVVQATRNTLATMLHQSGRVWARVQCRVNFVRVPARVKFFTTLISKTPGGFIVTGNGKYDMAWPKSHDVVRSRTMPVGQVWVEHQRRMTAAVQAVRPDQLLDVAEEYHASLRDFHLARGVFVPLGPEEIAMHASPPPPPPVAGGFGAPGLPAPDLLEAATLDELQRLQNKKANWRFSLALLALSAVFFVLQSRKEDGKQSWEFVAILVGVLLFHELGHYISMKVFGYRNLRMFFIPGFGAAVSGRHYNAPAWKKILVSLMGPLPGILVGSVALIASLFTHNDLMYRIGLFAVIINAFNLIPILPFDGGWVAHAAVFSRHPKLDVGFRVVAASVLMLIGMKVPGTSFLPYIAIAGLATLPAAHKLAMIVSELRPLPELGISPDSQTIPMGTARIILAKVRERFKRNLTARLAAQHVASVFESLNARPPSIGATIGLLSVHFAGFMLAAIALTIGIVVHTRAAHGPALQEPTSYVVMPSQIEAAGVTPGGPRNTVVIRFKDEPSAIAAFRQVTPGRSGIRYGQTMFVGFTPLEAAEQRLAFNKFKSQASDIFVISSKIDAQVELICKPLNSPKSREAFKELETYLPGSAWGLIPPWASEEDWPSEKRVPQTALRELLHELQSPPASLFSDQKDLWSKIDEAQRSGNAAEADRLEAEQKRLRAAAEAKWQTQLKEKYGQPEFVDKFVEIKSERDWPRRQKRLKEELGPLLGQWPPARSTELLVAQGYSFNTARSPRVYCTFKDIEIGLPALTRWLYAHDINDLHYRITGVPARTANMADDSALDDE